MSQTGVRQLSEDLVEGSRRALSRAITLVESTSAKHQDDAAELLDTILPHTGGSIRLGISGTPGVGKSTFINQFALGLIDNGHRVAVLAIDPTSVRTGGSILGDKTRMLELVQSPGAFVRPSPAAGSLGGVALRTRDAIMVCEAAGYDIVIVETVGVGQNETAVADVTDLFLLLLAPGGGDDLQGIKRGVMELADIIAVNKADGDLLSAANHTAADYRSALHLMRPKWPGHTVEVHLVSALTGHGMVDLTNHILEAHTQFRWTLIQRNRERQLALSFRAEVSERLVAASTATSDQSGFDSQLKAVIGGDLSVRSAAATIVGQYLFTGPDPLEPDPNS